MSRRETEKQLSKELSLNDFDFIESGTWTMSNVYEKVKMHYPQFCDDDYLCRDAHKSAHKDPEWHHIIRSRMQRSKNRSLRIHHISRNTYLFD